MNKCIKYIVFLLIISHFRDNTLYGQLSGNSLMEYQIGNIPTVDPVDLSTLYNQLNLKYRQKGINATLRLEQFYTNDSIDRNYVQLSQWQLSYRNKKIELKAGHFFETLGRGLLFRSFEIPASVKEEKTFRVRHGFYRDIQGVSFKYKGEIFRIKAIYGKPLQSSFPPGNDLRRVETIEAVQPEIALWKQNLGLIAMRHSAQGTSNFYSSLFLKGSLPLNFSYYGEYGRNMSSNDNPFRFSESDGYASYLSISHSYGGYGASFELKKYHNFQIGTGITDPPTLVKEHSYRLLNRTTHLIELLDEQGYQLDVFYTFPNGKTLSLNNSRAANKFLDTFTFNEWFLEFYWPFQDGSDLKSFIDYSSDEIIGDKDRYTMGAYYTHVFGKSWSAGFESEAQLIVPERTSSKNITNVYLGLVVSQSTKLSLSLYYEFSDNPIIADLANTSKRETKRHFYGIGASYRPNSNNTLSAFLGERRGGPACVSGICYEVLDFRGLEMRWTTKFNK